jgi:DNA-directed RNA polymerase specialized sigma24 family protein
MLLKETLKEQMKRQELHDLPSTVPPDLEDSSEAETQLGCLDGCLEKLPAEIRSLILEYYQFRRQAKIDHRRALAEGFGIPVNALRIRVHRVRAQLEECVTDCITAERRDMN